MITEATMTYDDMKKAVANGCLCVQCQGSLTIAWGGQMGIDGYILRCGNDINHIGITRHDKKHEQKLKEGFSMESNALMTMDEKTMLQRVEMARFPQDLTLADKKLLAQVAISYGFDPLMGEVTIYQGKPFVSIDGRYRKAQETMRLDGVETRPATRQEREDWQIPEGDYFFRSEVFVAGATHPFVAWGRVRKSETTGGKGFKPVETNPQRMAEKRAEAQALRKAFHIPLPSVEDIGSPDYDVDSTAREIDTSTGEITEGKSKKDKPHPEEAEKDITELWGEKPDKPPAPETPPQPAKPKTKPSKEESKGNGQGVEWQTVRDILRPKYEGGKVNVDLCLDKLVELGADISTKKLEQSYLTLEEDGRVAFLDWVKEV